MRSGLLSDLVVLGYKIFQEGSNIRYRYQKPDNPPVSAGSLIDELKKHKAEALEILKAGNITSHLQSTRKVIWKNPYPQGTPEARKESLRVVMEAITNGVDILALDYLKHDVLRGETQLADFKSSHLYGFPFNAL